MVRGRLTWPGVSVRATGGASIVRVTVRWVNKLAGGFKYHLQMLGEAAVKSRDILLFLHGNIGI